MKKKRLISFASVLLIFSILSSFCTFADGTQYDTNVERTTAIEYFEDGSYCVTEVEFSSSTRSALKTGSKLQTYYSDSGEKRCAIETTGAFKYDSNGVTCQNSYYKTYTYDSEWSVENVTTSKGKGVLTAWVTNSGNYVRKVLGVKIANFSFSNTLTCDTNGRLF